MAVPADDPDAAQREAVLELVAAAMEAAEQGGEPALQAFCAGLSEHRAQVLERIATLRNLGLLERAPVADSEAPERLGDFVLLERIGGGGMGVVHRAQQVSNDRFVAIKLIRADQVYMPGVRERFQREIEIVARLQHEGVVRLFDFGEERGIPWFAMELIAGGTLADVLQRYQGQRARNLRGADFAAALGPADGAAEVAGDVPLFAGSWTEVALRIVERAATALAEAHAKGVLHRDLKPSNVMVTPAGRVVLLDFGLAWSRSNDKLTRTGVQLGSIHYMAPEQVRGDLDAVDERTDVYGLGVVLRELLTLRVAFEGDHAEAVAQRILAGRPSPFERGASGAYRHAETVCERAMDPEPERRYPGVLALQRDLRCLLEQRPILARRASWGLRLRRLAQRHRALSSAALVAVLGLITTPLLVAVRERELRKDLETTNASLAVQMARARNNVDLAAAAINRTLRWIDAEDLRGVVDLRDFCDGVLEDSAAFQDALLQSNPADPAASLSLAETLFQTAMLRWQFRDHARAEVAFHRVLDLLPAVGDLDVDRTDALELDTCASLGGVLGSKQRDRAEIEAILRRGLDQVARRGAPTARPIAVRAALARCLERLALRGAEQRPGEVQAQLQQSVDLRRSIVAEAPTADAWLAMAASERLSVSHAGSAPEKEAHRALHLEALQAAEALAGDDVGVRMELILMLRQRGDELQTERRHAEALPFRERELVHAEWLVARRPSRLGARRERWSAWEGLARCALALGPRDRAVALFERMLQDGEAALLVWPGSAAVLRHLCATSIRLAQALAADPATASAQRRIYDRAIVAAGELAAAVPASATGNHAASVLAKERARFLLAAGEPTSALADAQSALQWYRDGAELGRHQGVQLLPDTELQLLCAEASWRCERREEALAILEGLGDRLPKNLLEQVPSLAAQAAEPRVAALLARAAAKR